MKNIKIYILASLLAVVLISGQPHASVASTNSSTFSFGLNAYDSSTQEFDVSMADLRVGLDPVPYPTLPLDDSTTQIVSITSDANLPSVRASVNIAGFTEIANSTGDLNSYVGQLYVIVNGVVSQGSAAIVTSSVAINLPLDVNTLTFFYVGMNNEGGLEYASETVIVKVNTAVPIEFVDVPVSLTATNEAASNDERFNSTGALAFNLFSGATRDSSISPVDASGLTISYTSAAGTNTAIDGTTTDVFVSEFGQFTVGGTYDGSGFRGQQAKGFNGSSLSYDSDATHPRTEGSVFVAHSDGVSLLSAESSTTVRIASTSSEDASVASPFSPFVLADFGYYDAEQDASIGSGSVDWDGITGATYGSTDFVADGEQRILFAQTAQVNIQDTTVESPGFGVALTLLAVGVIAYVVPRLRKD